MVVYIKDITYAIIANYKSKQHWEKTLRLLHEYFSSYYFFHRVSYIAILRCRPRCLWRSGGGPAPASSCSKCTPAAAPSSGPLRHRRWRARRGCGTTTPPLREEHNTGNNCDWVMVRKNKLLDTKVGSFQQFYDLVLALHLNMYSVSSELCPYQASPWAWAVVSQEELRQRWQVDAASDVRRRLVILVGGGALR